MQELKTFRDKYPQYSDIDDATLAGMLAEKYPDAYGDLPEKYKQSMQQQAPVQQQQPPAPGITVDPSQLSGNALKAAEELQRRGKLQFGSQLAAAPSSQEITQTPSEQDLYAMERGVGQKLIEPEPLATMGTGFASTVASGFAGLRTLLHTGDIDAAKKAVDDLQKQFTYLPKTEGGKESLQRIGAVVGPVAKAAGKGVRFAGETAMEIGGPYAGATTETVLRMIPEVLGLKIGKAAKIASLQKAVKTNPAALYDELGNVLPEIKKGLDEAGITVEEITGKLPRQEEILGTAAEKIGKAAESRKEAKAMEIAEESRPDAEILKAAEELGVEGLLPSHTAQNPAYVALEQGLKSIPGSQLATAEKTVISELGKKADELITEFGGELDKSLLSDRFRTESMELVERIGQQESNLFTKVNESIPPKESIDTSNIINSIKTKADELGGEKYLDKTERMLLKDLGPDTKPTYARLDKYRKLIGTGLKNKGPWKDADQGALKQMYKQLAKDQQAFADAKGYGDLYKSANNLTVQRKGIEEQLSKALGKELTGAVTTKGRGAILGLQKGDTKAFDELGKNIPEALGKETRRSVYVSALNDAFVQGSRKERSLNIAGFDDFMKGLNRNKVAKVKLSKEIGREATRRLDTMHKVISGIRKAQEQAITTGRITAVPKLFDEVNNIASRMYGIGKAASLAKGVTLGAVETLLNVKKTPRSVAADELLSSRKFQEMIKNKATAKLNTEAKIKRAEEIITNLKVYKKWEKTLPKSEVEDLTTIGAINYLTGEKEK